MDFIKKVRFEQERENEYENNDKQSANKELVIDEPESLSTQEMIYDSRERRHKNSTEFTCKKCSYKSPSKTLLMRHIERNHTQNNFSCDTCRKQFTEPSSLTEHTQSCHQETNFTCDQCEYKATSKQYLNNHIDLSHKQNSFNCDICEKQFTGPSYLKEHKLLCHQETTFTCDQCEYKATTKEHLNNHIESSHNLKQKKNYISKLIKCDLCGKKFNKEETFIKHKKQAHSSNNETYAITFQKFLRSSKKQ